MPLKADLPPRRTGGCLKHRGRQAPSLEMSVPSTQLLPIQSTADTARFAYLAACAQHNEPVIDPIAVALSCEPSDTLYITNVALSDRGATCLSHALKDAPGFSDVSFTDLQISPVGSVSCARLSSDGTRKRSTCARTPSTTAARPTWPRHSSRAPACVRSTYSATRSSARVPSHWLRRCSSTPAGSWS